MTIRLPRITGLRPGNERGRDLQMNEFIRDVIRGFQDIQKSLDDLQREIDRLQVYSRTPNREDTFDDTPPSFDYEVLPEAENASNLLWAWNETDTSQFSEILAPSSGTITLSVVTSNHEGPRLRMALSSHLGRSCFNVNDLTTLPLRYMFFCRIELFTSVGGGDGLAVSLCNNNTSGDDFRGIEYFRTPAAATWILYGARGQLTETGSTTNVGALMLAAEPAGCFELQCQREPNPIDTDSNELDMWVREESWGSSSTPHSGSIRNLDSITWNADWDGQSLTHFGLGYDSANAVTGNVELSNIVIMRHPMDWVA